MNKREIYLAASVATLVLLWGGTVGLSRYRDMLQSNEQVQLNTTQQLSLARTAEARGRRAQRLVRDWQRQSLPLNIDIAKSLYQDWLRLELDESGLIVKEIKENSPRTSQKFFRQATFVVSAQGSLSNLTDFLYRFYQSNHLHRISVATLVPTSTRKTLTVTLTVDALSLPGTPRTDQLAEGSSDTFEETLEEIEQEVVSRNIFLAFKSPTDSSVEIEPERVADDADTEAASAFITSLTRGASGWQMSIRINDSGKMLYYRLGDRIEIGRFSGQVLELDRRRVIVSDGEDRLEIVLGQNLGQARMLSDDHSS